MFFFNVFILDPISLFHCPLPKMNRPWQSDSTVNDANDLTLHKQDLMKFSKYAETLTIIGSQCGWIYGNQDLLDALKNVTKIIQIQAVNDTYFGSINGLLQTLINYGKVTHAVFSMVNLTRQNLSYLMQTCAGIHIQSKTLDGTFTFYGQEPACKKLKVDVDSHSLNHEIIPSTSNSSEMLTSVPQTQSYHSLSQGSDQYCLDLEVESHDKFPVDSSPSQDDEDDIDLYDEAVTPIPRKDPIVVRQMVKSDGSYVYLKGITTFALLNTNSHYKENFGHVLVDILPHWKSLTKFAIFDIGNKNKCFLNSLHIFVSWSL